MEILTNPLRVEGVFLELARLGLCSPQIHHDDISRGRGSEDLREALAKDGFGLPQNLTMGLVLSNIFKAWPAYACLGPGADLGYLHEGFVLRVDERIATNLQPEF